ncbi:hypothetical protein AVEN_25276-1 [Araneus ventricosus]|uniref:Uncharacterized protein n=1 Tax=Araneus ventricosus TaxID=182803 RepID=A0A4Y2TRJ3_ARAVE|nr:hypothetical protein AVEN_25276-1 [Araneus ventricosus]
MKFVQTLKNNPDLLKVIENFLSSDVNLEVVVDAGNYFLVALYGNTTSTSDAPSVNNVRYKCYMKSSFNKSINMTSLLQPLSCSPAFLKSLPLDPTMDSQ